MCAAVKRPKPWFTLAKHINIYSCFRKSNVSNELQKLYGGHIANGYILCTNSHKSYMQFANDL